MSDPLFLPPGTPAPTGERDWPAPTGQPAPPGPPAPAGPGFVQPPRQENGQAVTALTLGIVGLSVLFLSAGLLAFVSLPCSIVAWVLGTRALRRPDGRSQAKAGQVLGILGTVLGVLALLGWIAIILFVDVGSLEFDETDGFQLTLAALR